ncbi:hypothetical protein BC832DRAFT_589499 [Gaertneriomyces semiglobifer]|nr:hypothetical protein BC832DRAFT_589499 [Gaertneriomyces semiglobifer]
MCTIGEVSSESGSEQEPSALDPVHVAYTAGKLVKNLFDPVMFAKYNGWKNDTMKDWAKEYLHDGVKESVKDLNGKNRAKAKLLNIKRNVERLKLYDWNSEASAWQQHWETLEIQRTLRHNKLKRAFAIDSEMTEGLQGLSRAHTVTKKNKQDHWEQVLCSDLWQMEQVASTENGELKSYHRVRRR